MPCVRTPAVTVGLINSPAAARFGPVGGWAGHEPTVRTNCCCRLPDAQVKGRSFSLHWDNGGGGDQRELLMQVSTAEAVMSAKAFDRRRPLPLIAAAHRAAV